MKKLPRRSPHYLCAPGDDFEPLLDAPPRAAQGGSGSGDSSRRSDIIKLVVLKLDGTSFGFDVPARATVGQMKSVLESKVNELEMEMLGYCDIQWDQVWSNFCLCYMNQKLLDDKASLRACGILEDEQIRFLRHTAGEASSAKRRSFCRYVFARSISS